MIKGKVKQKFINDFNSNFYQFNGKEIHESLVRQIKYQNEPIFENNYNSKTNFLTILSRVLVALVIVSTIVIVGNSINNKKHVNVDDLFETANIEYAQEPILASSSYNGEVLRIYQAIEEKQYYYFFNQIDKMIIVDHLHFINHTKDINIVINVKDNFGNLSELIDISNGDEIEVIIVYENNNEISKTFKSIE